MRPSLAVARTRIRPYRRLHRARPMSPRAFRHIGLPDRSEPGEAPRAEPPRALLLRVQVQRVRVGTAGVGASKDAGERRRGRTPQQGAANSLDGS